MKCVNNLIASIDRLVDLQLKDLSHEVHCDSKLVYETVNID